MIFWPIVVFRTIATFYYMSAEIVNHTFNIGLKKWYIILMPALLIFTLLFPNEAVRRDFYGTATLYVGIYDIIYITLVAILISIKGKLKSSL